MRYRRVDLYRILFAVIIVLAHGVKPPDPAQRLFGGGYLAVEFFLILTGYFAAKKADAVGSTEHAARDAAVWTAKKFLHFYQYVIPAVIIHYLVYAWIENFSIAETIRLFLYGIYEMLLLSSLGIYEKIYVSPLWYLSALLAILPLIYFMAIRFRDTFFYLICPLSALFVYGYFSMTYGHVNVWDAYTGIFFMCLPRVWVGCCLGGLSYLISERLKKINFSGGGGNAFVC